MYVVNESIDYYNICFKYVCGRNEATHWGAGAGGGEGREGGTGFAKGSLKINKSTEKGLFIVELF